MLATIFTSFLVFAAKADSDVEVKFTTSKGCFLKGEPVIAICTISNRSNHDIFINYNCNTNLSFGCNGGLLQSNPTPIHGGATIGPNGTELKPNEICHLWVALDEWSLEFHYGTNFVRSIFNYNGVKMSDRFDVNLTKSNDHDLGIALGALVAEIAATTNPQEQDVLREAIHIKQKQSPEIRPLLQTEFMSLKDIIDNADNEPID
jgi:hypothetical protein